LKNYKLVWWQSTRRATWAFLKEEKCRIGQKQEEPPLVASLKYESLKLDHSGQKQEEPPLVPLDEVCVRKKIEMGGEESTYIFW
jgi:hypothetical protein